MEIKKEKICKYCGKTYLGVKSQKFCSRECFFNSLKKRVMVHCVYCGKEIIKPKRFVDKFKKSFCSRECQILYQKKSKIKKKCIVCGKDFWISPSKTKSNCCSHKCANLINNQKQQNKNGLNKLEKEGQKILLSLGLNKINFQEQKIIEGFLVDVFVPKYNLIIEWDGDYWHYNPLKFNLPDSRQRKKIGYDKLFNSRLSQLGYKILRFWESEVYNQPDKVKNKIYETIQNSN